MFYTVIFSTQYYCAYFFKDLFCLTFRFHSKSSNVCLHSIIINNTLKHPYPVTSYLWISRIIQHIKACVLKIIICSIPNIVASRQSCPSICVYCSRKRNRYSCKTTSFITSNEHIITIIGLSWVICIQYWKLMKTRHIKNFSYNDKNSLLD